MVRNQFRKRQSSVSSILLWTLAAALLGAGWVPASAFAEPLRIQSFKTHGRLSLNIDESIPAEWKNSAKGFEILLRGATLTELGLSGPQHLRTPADPRLGPISIQEVSSGVVVKGEWKYPSGRNAPADPGMETFEYRESGLRYIVDFWMKKGPTVAEVEAARLRAARKAEEKVARKESKDRAARRLASEKARQETENAIQGICSEPLRDSTDIFLPFLPFHEKVDFGRWFSARVPDENYSYFIPESKNRDAQYVRLALDLYNQGKPALSVRTLEFFEREHPGSEFRHEMRLLKASALVKLGLGGEADEILAQLMTDAKDSPVGLHAALFQANSRFQAGNHLAALESFLWLANRYPKHRLNWVFHLGAAESLYSLKQTERAAKEYQWVIEYAPSDAEKAEAAARVGDLYLDRFHYEQALASYYESLSHFPKQAKGFPSVYVNRAEALYQLGQYDRAKDAFSDFLKQYPAHPAGWRAALRLGEILGRQSGEAARAESRRWYSDVVNRYPFSPGATLARLRLVPCGDQGGFDVASLERFFSEEAARFDGGGEVQMSRYGLFRALSQVRALITANRIDQAVSVALVELGKPSNTGAQAYLGKIISYLFRQQIMGLLEEGKKYEALSFYQERREMLSRENPAELDYLLALSRAASELGLGTLGKDLVETHEKAHSRAMGRAIASNDPAAHDPDEQLRASERKFTRAKALWVSAAGSPNAAEIRTLLAGVSDESRYSFEKYVILSLLEEREGNLTAALAHAARAQVLVHDAALADTDLALRLEAHVALLQMNGGDPRIALDLLRALGRKAKNAPSLKSEKATALELLPAPTVETIFLAEAEVLEKLGRWGEAVGAYSAVIEKGMGGDRAAFGHARALLKSGSAANVEKGRVAMRKLASVPGEGFWKKLAAETLANETRGAKEGGK